MSTVVTDPYTLMADAIEAVIVAEFDDDPYLNVIHDRLHESLGSDGLTHVGLSPESEPLDNIEMRIEMLIQFYGAFLADVNPNQVVDPREITNKAERLRRALAAIRTSAGNSHLWFFDVTTTRYPNDATGNKTRFEMSVVGRGQNSGLIETTG